MTYAWSTPEYQQKASDRAKALYAARRRLIEAHQEEYDAYHREERVARGLPPEHVAGVSATAALRRRITELEHQVAQLKDGA